MEQERNAKYAARSDSVYLIEMPSTKNTIVLNGICPTLTSRMGTGGQPSECGDGV